MKDVNSSQVIKHNCDRKIWSFSPKALRVWDALINSPSSLITSLFQTGKGQKHSPMNIERRMHHIISIFVEGVDGIAYDGARSWRQVTRVMRQLFEIGEDINKVGASFASIVDGHYKNNSQSKINQIRQAWQKPKLQDIPMSFEDRQALEEPDGRKVKGLGWPLVDLLPPLKGEEEAEDADNKVR